MLRRLGYLLLILTLAVACEEFNGDCYDEKPLEGELKVKVNIRDTTNPVQVSVYQGKFDEQNLLFSELIIDNEITYFLPVNSYYSASAEYEDSGKIILVIDGGKISVKKINNDDGSTCWSLKNVELDLRLK